MTRCIYCGIETNLSESDIIPVALTNSKLTKKNVCKDLHNNFFGRTFEAEVINKLSFLRDNLDIKTKDNKYPETEVSINIDDTIYKKRANKNSTLFRSNIMTSKEGKSKIGPLEQIKKIAESETKKGNKIADFNEIDLNNKVIETQIQLNLDVFFSISMKRLIAKIAYEWYCCHYNIEDYYIEFAEIVDYICNKEAAQNNDLVKYIKNVNIYSAINNSTVNGSHTLIAYEKNDGSVNILVSFFGICIYNVKILNAITRKYKQNCFLQEFQVTSKKVTLPRQSFADLNQFIFKNTISIVDDASGLEIRYPKDLNNTNVWEGVDLYYTLVPTLMKTPSFLEYDQELIDLLLFNYNKVINEAVVHIRSLKRFVKERLSDGEYIQINPKGTDPEKFFMFYLVFLIGKANIVKVDIDMVTDIIKQAFSINKELIINSDLANKMLAEITSIENYTDILYAGAKRVEESDYDYGDR